MFWTVYFLYYFVGLGVARLLWKHDTDQEPILGSSILLLSKEDWRPGYWALVASIWPLIIVGYNLVIIVAFCANIVRAIRSIEW